MFFQMLFSKCNIYMKNNESLQQDVGVVHASSSYEELL